MLIADNMFLIKIRNIYKFRELKVREEKTFNRNTNV